MTSEECYPDYMEERYGNSIWNKKPDESSLCLSEEENHQLLMAYAKNGDLATFDALISSLYPTVEKKLDGTYRYVHGYSDSIPAELKPLYDKAIKANNGRNWAVRGHVESIEMWERTEKRLGVIKGCLIDLNKK